jgi:hypothetical protein
VRFDHEGNVDRGIALLDEKVPGWEHRIDLDILKLSACHECIIGQLMLSTGLGEQPPVYVDYYEFQLGVERLGLNDADQEDERYGFNLYDTEPQGDEDEVEYVTGQDWQDLTETWKRKILERRSMGA